MKKIDAWLDIQRFVEEAHKMPVAEASVEVEMIARSASQESKGRIFINNRTTV